MAGTLTRFGASFLLCAIIGALVRIEYDHGGNKAEISSLGFMTVQDGLQLAALRAKLDILNSSASDQAILNLAAQELKDQRSAIDTERLRFLTEQAKKVLDALATARKVSAPANADVNDDLTALENSLEIFRHSAVAWRDVGMPHDIYTIYHNSLWFRLSRFESQNKPGNLAWVQTSKLDRASLDVLLQNIHSDFLKFDLLDWRVGKPMSDSLDDFLTVAIKRQKNKRDEFMPSIDMSTDESKSAEPSSKNSEESDKAKAK